MKVFRVLDFSEPFSEEDIALQSDLEPDKVNSAIFALMKWNICEGCIDGRFLLGSTSVCYFRHFSGNVFRGLLTVTKIFTAFRVILNMSKYC